MRINWLGVLISAIIIVLVRHVWYAYFGGAEAGQLPMQVIDQIRGDTTLAGKELVNALVVCLGLAWLVDALRNRSLPEGFATGLGAGIAFALTSISADFLHGAPLRTFLVDGGYLLLAYVLAGAILGAMAPKRSSRSKFDWGGSEPAAEH